MIRVLIAEQDGDFAYDLVEAINRDPGMELVGMVTSDRELISTVSRTRPQLVFLDLSLGSGNVSAVAQLREQVAPPPRIVGMAAGDQEALAIRAVQQGADYCVLKPFDLPTLLTRGRQLVVDPKPGALPSRLPPASPSLQSVVEEELRSLGMPTTFKGFRYLVEAIAAVVKEPDLINAVTKRLYPLVAARHQSSPRRVERAIRTCIEATWVRGDPERLERLFRYQVDSHRGKPTNSAFIAQMATLIRLRRQKGSLLDVKPWVPLVGRPSGFGSAKYAADSSLPVSSRSY